MSLSTINKWLEWLYKDHSDHIEFGLARALEVASRLGLLETTCPLIIVGGTNGKGSTVKAIESMACAANYQVGCFTSPYLLKVNEQVRINGNMVDDETLCHAFEDIAKAEQDVPLTPFERFTLAALLIFKKTPLDLMVLEVGLGGRLDAVNIMTPTISVVTTIGIDHVVLLGDTREKIGREKAGIFRREVPAICGDPNPPESIVHQAIQLQSPFFCQGKAFHYVENEMSWDWWCEEARHDNLPIPSLALQNMATALMAITCLKEQLPISHDAIVNGLQHCQLPGRIQIVEGEVKTVFDVAHNAHAIQFLKQKLNPSLSANKTHAVFSMLADKDIVDSILCMKESVTHWYVAPLDAKRAATKQQLMAAFKEAEVPNVTFFDDIVCAYEEATSQAKKGENILVFGSFYTVAAIQYAIC